MHNMAVERDGLQAALAGSLRASRSGYPSPLRCVFRKGSR